MLVILVIAVSIFIVISAYMGEHDNTNICNKIYRKLVSKDNLEHLSLKEWVDLEKTILEKWKYASESYSKTFIGRINARQEYKAELLREAQYCEGHISELWLWDIFEPSVPVFKEQVYGSHPSKSDEEDYKKSVEKWREDMKQNRFAVRFKKLLQEKNVANPDVYKSANIDRKLFSKIISNEYYVPEKKTVLALAVALKLDIDETISMLQWAGYTFSDCILSDIIVRFFIEKGIYDVDKINEALYRYDQSILGSSVREK